MKFLQVFVLVCCVGFGYATSSSEEEVTEDIEACCTHGEMVGIKANSREYCKKIGIPKDLAQTSTCKDEIQACCLKQIVRKKDCSEGIKLAKDRLCAVPKTDIGKTCCEECAIGRWTGDSQGTAACGGPAEDYGSPDAKLRETAYYQCCMSAATEAEMTTTTKATTTSTTEPPTTQVVTSSTTTARPRQICKPNSCTHNCSDVTGVVLCTCHEGYRLQSDKKTCKDINECAESSDDLCTAPDTVCHNMPGSFKCVPIKKRAATFACPAGYKMNNANQACDDINECLSSAPPCPKYLCENTIGAFKCAGKLITPVKEDPNQTSTGPPREPRLEICPPGFRVGNDDECADIDECQDNLDDCQRLSQYCINTHGHFFCQDHVSKRCTPGFKVNASGVCEDIDECTDSVDVCKRTEVCVNLPGAYICKSKISTLPKLTTNKNCQEGTRMRPGGQACEDIDECREGIHLCDSFQNCVNTFGGHECRCKPGFELDSLSGSCIDIDECAMKLDNCEEQQCLNVLGSFTCQRQSRTTPQPPAAQPTSPEYEYVYYDEDYGGPTRPPGLRSVSLPPLTPINRRPSEDPNTTPTATPRPHTSPHSTVRPLTSTSTITPSTRRTTTERPTPRPTTSPTTTSTSSPTTSTITSPTTSSTRPPTTSSTRPPTITSPRPVYISHPTTTTEGNKPDLTFNNPYPYYYDRTTTSTVRPYRPYWYRMHTTTPKPFTNKPKPRYPSEVDLIASDDDNPLVLKKDANDGFEIDTNLLPENKWTNVAVQRKPRPNVHVVCPNGYEKDSRGECTDIDECAQRQHTCSSLETCVNRPGGFSCACAKGFQREPGGWCAAISTSPRNIEPAVYGPEPANFPARTPFSPGGQKPSSCDFGFEWSPQLRQCVDKDECARNEAKCNVNEDCVNTPGGYQCVCGRRCRGVDESTPYAPVTPRTIPTPNPDPNVITVGSQYGQKGPRVLNPQQRRLAGTGAIVVSCPWGYKLTPERTCVDLDECARNTSECGPEQRCENFHGGYSCQCPLGYRLTGPDQCTDIDECQHGNSCSYNAKCVNTVGSFRCECNSGFQISPTNPSLCADVDECANPTICHQKCANSWGSYRCFCDKGYRMQNDNRTCLDVDECSEWASGRTRGQLCGGQCVNELGSYRCTCPQGYRLGDDRRSCIDIDECETGMAPCARTADPSQVCQNTRGSYHCHRIVCPPGYRLEGKHRCIRIQRTCPISDWDCLQQPSTFSYNFITFVAKLYLPSGSVDLFTMHGPNWQDTMMSFELRLVNVQARAGVQPAELSCFNMRPTRDLCIVSLVCSLEGPQVVELELTMSLYQRGHFGGRAVARLFVIVSEYEY